MDVPGCGKSSIYWKKLCGIPTSKGKTKKGPRKGFSIDLKFKSFNQTIVRNGIVINSSYFDKDLDNVVYRAPYDDNQTVFYLYMNEEDLKGIDKTKDAFTAMARTNLKPPRVDSDLAVMNPKLIYDSKGLGVVNQSHFPLILQYQCLKNDGEATVELNIEFDYYKSITLFFKKCCNKGHDSDHINSKEGKSKTSIFFTFLMFLVIAYIVALFYSFYFQKESLKDSLTLNLIVSTAVNKFVPFFVNIEIKESFPIEKQ